ncbi:MAG: hypothetical protein WBF71_12630 [Microthrixaceae bacterium]
MSEVGRESPQSPADQPAKLQDAGRWVLATLEIRWLQVVVGLSVLTSLAAAGVAARAGSTVSFADEQDYLSLGTNLAGGLGFTMDGVHPTAFRPPGFPMFLSLVATVKPELTALRVGNALLAGVVVFLGSLLAKRILNGAGAAVAAVALVASPVAFYTATKLYPQTLAACLLLGGLLAVFALEQATGTRFRVGWSVVAGLCLSGLTLTVPNHGVTLVVAVIWLAARMKRSAMVVVGVLLVAFLVPIGAWTVRNYSVFDRVVPVSTNGGINLLLGNSEHAGSNTGVNVDISRYIDEAHRRDLDEVEVDKFFQEQAIDWIRENPTDAAGLYVGKFLNTFSVQQEFATRERAPSKTQTLVIAVTYLPLLALFLLRHGAVGRVPLRRGEPLLIGAFWTNALVGALAFTRIRFRVPVDPLMTVIAVIFLVGLLDAYVNRGARPAEAELAAAGAATVPVEDPSE